MKQLKQLYTECMNCGNSNKQCPKIIKNKSTPPRGFYFEKQNIDILIVGKNPGHILPDEKIHLKNKNNDELLAAWIEYRKKYYSTHKENVSRSATFHKKLYKYIEYFIDGKDIFKHVAETNLVKCSTEGESKPLSKITKNECYNKYLINEINFFNPKVILALGREVEEYLNDRNGIDFKCKVIYIKHPTYSYKKEKEIEILNEIKKQIDKELK